MLGALTAHVASNFVATAPAAVRTLAHSLPPLLFTDQSPAAALMLLMPGNQRATDVAHTSIDRYGWAGRGFINNL